MIASVYHGGDLKAVKQSNPDVTCPWVDLSTGLNPVSYPWQAEVPNDILANAAAVLPQQELVEECVNAWTAYLKAKEPNEWLLTAGSQAIINILPQLLPDHQAVIPEPCYGEHERVWHRRSHEPHIIPRDKLIEYELQKNQVVILTSPNNPDGYIWTKKVLFSLAKTLEQKDGYLVLDEAFADVAPETSIAAENLPDNVILLRSFGKFFGLAGTRLGLVRIPAKFHSKVQAILGPWAVSGLGAVIAKYALTDDTWIKQTRSQLHQKTKGLRDFLEQTNGKILGGTDLFYLMEFEHAQNVMQRLNSHAIHVRSFEKHPNWLRFGLPADTFAFDRLKEALNE